MPGLTFTLCEYQFEMIELAYETCGRRLQKARLIEQHGGDCGVARLRKS
jgi:hypothetical protein